MGSKTWTVAFVGSGVANKENVKETLDDWLHDGRNYAPPIIPDKISRQETGLTEVWSWLDREFGPANVDKLDPDALLATLDRRKGDQEVYLVYIPGDDDPYADLVTNALKWDIPVLDLTHGLYPYEAPKADEPEPAAEEPKEESTARRPRRGAPRNSGPSEAELDASMSDPNPPWEDGEKVAEAQQAIADAYRETVTNAKVSVELSQNTIDLFLAALASFAADITTAARPQSKAKTQPFWHNAAEGTYRKRGQGRGRKGEDPVDLTDAEVEDLENRGLL